MMMMMMMVVVVMLMMMMMRGKVSVIVLTRIAKAWLHHPERWSPL